MLSSWLSASFMLSFSAFTIRSFELLEIIMKTLLCFVVLSTFVSAECATEKSLVWPRFRGPNGSGVAEGQKPPTEFGPEKNVKWKVPVPAGMSSPIAAGENLVLTAFEGDKLLTIAYNR